MEILSKDNVEPKKQTVDVVPRCDSSMALAMHARAEVTMQEEALPTACTRILYV